MKCPVCGEKYNKLDYQMLARHLAQLCERSDSTHLDFVKYYIPSTNWLDKEFTDELKNLFTCEKGHLADWITEKLIQRMFGHNPHPFIASLQNPKKAVFQGYAVEYNYYLQQRIKSFSYALAKTDRRDIQKLEITLIANEILDDDASESSEGSLLRAMAQSVGIPTDTLQSSMPLPPTMHAGRLWNQIAESDHWLEVVASINLMDLIYSPKLSEKGAKMPYFGNTVLENEWIPEPVKDFLKFTVSALSPLAEASLSLLQKYSEELGMIEDVQSVFLRSLEAFDRHLQARVTRAKQFESK